MIQYENVTKTYDGGETLAIRGVSLTVEDGETMVLLGGSGCGKTTLLKMTNRLVETSGGVIRVDSDDISTLERSALRRRIGYVFQGVGLFPHMSVEENIAITLRLTGADAARRKDRARELLTMVELDPDAYAGRYPDELSGGQAQRVGVARALAADPKYLLMDEPFGALDTVTRETLQREVLRLKKRLGKTVIFVTHDIFEALVLGDRIAVLNNGSLEQIGGREDLINNPQTDFVAELFAAPRRQLDAFRDLLEAE